MTLGAVGFFGEQLSAVALSDRATLGDNVGDALLGSGAVDGDTCRRWWDFLTQEFFPHAGCPHYGGSLLKIAVGHVESASGEYSAALTAAVHLGKG